MVQVSFSGAGRVRKCHGWLRRTAEAIVVAVGGAVGADDGQRVAAARPEVADTAAHAAAVGTGIT
jgi:hypothetical protein